MAKTKVLHLITRLIRGGADENTVYTVCGLDRSRFQVDLLYGQGSEPQHLIPEDRNDIGQYFLPELRREIAIFADLSALFKIYRIIRRGRYDIVHTHTAKAGFLGRIAAFLARTPIVIHTLHGATFGEFVSPLRHRVYVALEKISAALTDKMISVGEDLKERYLQRRIGNPGQYLIIRSGMDLGEFYRAGSAGSEQQHRIRESLGLRDTDYVIGNISRLEPRKGHGYFIEAAAAICPKHPEVKFLIVGDGELRGALEQQVRELNLSGVVLFTGFRKDIAQVLATFDILALTSLWEGLPRVLVQAAAVGKPIVSFSVEGAREIVEEGKNGFVVPAKDVSLLVERLTWLIENPRAGRQMGEWGKSRVDDEWRVETMVEKIQNLYDKLLLKKRLALQV